MTSKTHAALGLCTGATMLLCLPNADIYTTLSGTLLGSLIPDLDTKKSDPSQILPFLSKIVDAVTKHRGATHTILPLLLLILYFITNYYPLFCLGLGALSHFIIDRLTKVVKIKCSSRGEDILYKLFLTYIIMLPVVAISSKYASAAGLWHVCDYFFEKIQLLTKNYI